MGKIRWMFDGVPGEKDHRSDAEKREAVWSSVRFAGIYGDLARMGRPVPVTPHHKMERADLVDHLRAVAGDLVRQAVKDGKPPLEALNGLPHGPNALTAEDIEDALG